MGVRRATARKNMPTTCCFPYENGIPDQTAAELRRRPSPFAVNSTSNGPAHSAANPRPESPPPYQHHQKPYSRELFGGFCFHCVSIAFPTSSQFHPILCHFVPMSFQCSEFRPRFVSHRRVFVSFRLNFVPLRPNFVPTSFRFVSLCPHVQLRPHFLFISSTFHPTSSHFHFTSSHFVSNSAELGPDRAHHMPS